MSIQAGTHTIGPGNGSLKVKTGREGAAAKMGHDLVIGVGSWEGTVEGGDSPSVKLTADASSLEVLEGSGGAKPLSDKDRGDIKKSIAGKVLGSSPISFESTSVEDNGSQLLVKGTLSIAGGSSQVSIPLSVGADGTVSGSATLSQSDFQIKQFSAMMGALKVKDDVAVEIEAKVPTG
ncbi:MAG: YceI family protein [Solirubrobacteraceae bacterium]|nr:YceI family protein [Solirubrobacteraceae bacterium]